MHFPAAAAVIEPPVVGDNRIDRFFADWAGPGLSFRGVRPGTRFAGGLLLALVLATGLVLGYAESRAARPPVEAESPAIDSGQRDAGFIGIEPGQGVSGTDDGQQIPNFRIDGAPSD